MDDLELYVKSDKESAARTGRGLDSPTDDSDPDYSSDHRSPCEGEEEEASPYGVSKLEAHFYYFGIRGPKRGGAQVDLPDIQAYLYTALGARQDSSSHAAMAILRASQTWQGQSVGYHSF